MRTPRSLARAALVPAVLLVLVPWAAGQAVCAEEHALAGTGGSGVAFGRSVAVDGDLAVVCGDLEAYAFGWNGTSWDQEALLSIPGAESGFGASAALSGDTVLLGLPEQDGAAADEGRALVFVRDGSGLWSLEAELSALDADLGDRLGAAVALEGNRAVVGAPGDDGLAGGAGAVYVFERAGTSWSEVAKLTAPVAGSGLGSSVALSGDTLVAASAQFTGGSHAFVETAGLWSHQAELAPLQLLPTQIALDGERVLLGGLFEALVLERGGGVWSEAAALPYTTQTVALDGDLLLLGGPSCPSTPAVRVLERGGAGWSELATLAIQGSQMPLSLSGRRALVGARGGLACAGGLASAFDVGFAGPPPAVVHRNAGTNPDSFRAVPGSYGETLEFTIDLTTTGHSLGLVIGFDSPFELTLAGGQTLLCLDLLGSGGELINTGFFLGPIVDISLPIPNDPVYAGFTICTQAVHAFGVTPFALSNAQDVTIGGCP